MQDERPVGIVTDRDLVLRVISADKDPAKTVVEEVMTPNPLTLDEELGLFEALEIMKSEGVRRFPVVDVDGKLAGIFTVDDVLFCSVPNYQPLRALLSATSLDTKLLEILK